MLNPSVIVDMTRSLPPIVPSLNDAIHNALLEIGDEQDFSRLLRSATPIGSDEERAAAQTWLTPRYTTLSDDRRIIATNGTQSALLLFLRTHVAPGGLLLAEQLSYGILPILARTANVRLQGVKIDDDGILPDDFERLCRSAAPAALYCNPTCHNPTTSTLPLDRRIAIAAIARRYGVRIFEDEPLGLLHPTSPPPIATMAPDLTWYTVGMTKCIAQGIRVAFSIIPDSVETPMDLGEAGRLSHWLPSPLSLALVTRLIVTGRAKKVLHEIRSECLSRQRMASELLCDLPISCPPGAMHLWMRSTRRGDEKVLVSVLAKQGVLVRGSAQFDVEAHKDGGIALRLSLSSPTSRSALADGLSCVAKKFAEID